MEALLQFLAQEDGTGELGGQGGRWGCPCCSPRATRPGGGGCSCSPEASVPAEPPSRTLALSSLQTFKALGVSTARTYHPSAPQAIPPPTPGDAPVPPQVLEETQTPSGALLQLSQPFQSASAQSQLEAFIQQFHQP